MSNRLDQQREAELQPQRMNIAKLALQKLGYKITFEDPEHLQFVFNGETVRYWPYSGWHTGKSIRDGRGLENLLRQIR